ncbi:hypothetical protein [Desulfobacter sp.]|uniref:hypothetical protein n=1 Tax=Desulfobacter sp. TaxID=2294 RepID=UPI003D0AD4B6
MKKTAESRTEMIIVRVYSISETHALHEILKEISELSKTNENSHHAIFLCKNEHVESDWAVCFQNSAIEGHRKSVLATYVAEMLRSVGLVNHTVWKLYDARDDQAVDELMSLLI